MSNTDKQLKNYELKQDSIQQRHLVSARVAKKTCYYPSCANTAISSHILQKNGVLSEIVDNKRKFRELSMPTPFRPYGFYSVGSTESQMFTYNGFCNEHDTSLFLEIEDGTSDFSAYRHKLLLSYRGLVHDLFKAEMMIDYFNRLKNDSEYSRERYSSFQHAIAANKLAIKDLEYYKHMIEKDLSSGNEDNIHFVRLELPKYDIATSTIFGGAFYTQDDLDKTSSLDPLSSSYIPVSKPVFLNIIPTKSSLLLILGYVSAIQSIEEIAVNDLSSLSVKQAFNLLNRLLLRVETWGMSENLHTKWITDGRIADYLALNRKWLNNSKKQGWEKNRTDAKPSISHSTEIPSDYDLFKEIS